MFIAAITTFIGLLILLKTQGYFTGEFVPEEQPAPATTGSTVMEQKAKPVVPAIYSVYAPLVNVVPKSAPQPIPEKKKMAFPKPTVYIPPNTSEYYKNTQGSRNWGNRRTT